MSYHSQNPLRNLPHSPLSSIDLAIQDQVNELPWLTCKDRNRALNLNLGLSGNQKFNHSLGYTFLWRHLKSNADERDNLKFSVRRKLGHSLKQSVTYNCTYSTLKNVQNSIPTQGYELNPSLEFAGFSGSSKFLKFNFGSKMVKSLGKLTLHCNTKLGCLAGSNIDLQDKFYLGGPLDLRGFDQNTANVTTGGNNIAGIGLHAYYPIHGVLNGLNLHTFLTTGACFNKLHEIGDNLKTSVGAGLSLGIMEKLKLEYRPE